MKVLVFTPVYRPDEVTKKNLIDRMRSGIDQAIFLNSDFEIPCAENLLVFGDGKNRGISAPFNEVMRYSSGAGYDFVLFLDQDTKVNLKSLMTQLQSIILKFESQKTAVLFLRSDKFCDRLHGELITNSGALFSVDNFFEAGGFNENYFLDGLDYDFCLNVWRKGFKIFNIPLNHCFDHVSLQEGRSFRFMGKALNIRRYSDIRYKEIGLFYKATIVSLAKHREWRLFYLLLRSFLIFRLGRLLSFMLGQK